MHIRRLALSVALALALHAPGAGAAPWTYRGTLADQGHEAQGTYGFRLSLHDAAEGGRRIGNEVTLPGVKVAHGAFESEVDFGVDVAAYGKLWLAVEVQDASGAFVPIARRDPIEPKALEAGVCWDTGGNAAVAGDFLGTTNATPLQLKVNNLVGGTFAPTAVPIVPGAINVVFGSPANGVVAGAAGSTVGGGGMTGTNCGFGSLKPCGNFADGSLATVAGGRGNVAGPSAVVSGGIDNDASDTGNVIGGGVNNATAGNYAAVLGGSANLASGDDSTVGGGVNNSATGDTATIVGGAVNIAAGKLSTVLGGSGNWAGGDLSVAAGRYARVRDKSVTPGCGLLCGDFGSFVWADTQDATFTTTGPNQFMLRAAGGVAINKAPVNNQVELSIYPGANSADYVDVFMRQKAQAGGILVSAGDASNNQNNAAFYIDQYDGTTQNRVLTLAGNGDFSVSANAYKPGGGSWAAPSDARLKRNVQPLGGALEKLLELRGVRYEYAHPDTQLHPAGEQVGFIAQEVATVFPDWVGHSADGYLTVGPRGFEALSVEAMRELRAEQDGKVEALKRENEALRERLARIEARLGGSGAP